MTTENYLGELFDFSDAGPKRRKKIKSITSRTEEISATHTAAKPLSVSQLTRQIRRQLENNFVDIIVEGEISTFKAHISGHYYFTLKDKSSQIPAVMFRGANSRLKFTPENGMLVVVRGNVKIYEPQGKYQIVCESMEPSGVGAMQLAFEQLKKKLSDEGLFDEARKKPLPVFPKIIGVVTSASGAAFHDIKNVLFRRFPNSRLVLNPAPVQGEGAAEKIARAIDECNEAKKCGAVDFDVLIVGRGGGSMEDLWCFNEEEVARAIARSDLPVISAVGHEIDWTIADFVADRRAPTPSAAAEIAVKPRDEWLSQIIDLRRRLKNNLEFTLENYKNRLAQAKQSYVFREPRRLIDVYRQRVDEFTNTMNYSLRENLSNKRNRLVASLNILNSSERIFKVQIEQRRKNLILQMRALENVGAAKISNYKSRVENLLRQLEAVSPVAVLKRGFTITKNATGKIILSAGAIKENDIIITDFRDGSAESKINKITLKEK